MSILSDIQQRLYLIENHPRFERVFYFVASSIGWILTIFGLCTIPIPILLYLKGGGTRNELQFLVLNGHYGFYHVVLPGVFILGSAQLLRMLTVPGYAPGRILQSLPVFLLIAGGYRILQFILYLRDFCEALRPSRWGQVKLWSWIALNLCIETLHALVVVLICLGLSQALIYLMRWAKECNSLESTASIQDQEACDDIN